MRARSAVLAAVLAAGALAVVPATAAPSGFVTRVGSQLMIDGQPWKAIGVNVWDMDAFKALANDLTGCYYQRSDLDAYFDATFREIATRTHATVVRTFGFREQYTSAGQDWSSTDKLLYYARKHDVRVIPVFGDQFGTCGAPYKTPDWYHCLASQPDCLPGYKRPTVWGRSYRAYVVDAVRRYKDDPTVAWWQLMNEPMYGRAGQDADTTALADFSRDMVRAIHEEAGDTNHLISTGTTGQRGYTGFSPNGVLLDCTPSSGGCSDLSEIHDYSRQPLQGLPLLSTAVARIVTSNKFDPDYVSPPTYLTIDGWTTIKATMPQRNVTRPDLYWSILITWPRSPGWTLHADDGIVTTAAGPTVYSFETGSDGFTGTGATFTQSAEMAQTGLGSLKGVVPFGNDRMVIQAPVLPGPSQSVQISLRLKFDGPAAEEAGGIAGVLHTAVIRHLKPFFSGEVGIPAQVPGATNEYGLPDAPLDQCTQNTTLLQRAQTFDQMLALQTDADHRSSGLIFWDFKDPLQTPIDAEGRAKPDPMISCYSVTPADPAVEVIRSWAEKVPPAPLPAAGDVPAGIPFLAVFSPPPATAGIGVKLPVKARLTNGGDVVRGAKIVAAGACAGSGSTNALGIADFTCTTAGAVGPSTMTLTVDATTCGCSVEPKAYPIALKRAILVAASSGVAEHGDDAPVAIAISSADGSSVKDVPYSIPACGVSGSVAEDEASVVIHAACPTGMFDGPAYPTISVGETDTTLPAATPFTLLVFDQIYVDVKTGDCVGFSPLSGWAGASDMSNTCGGALGYGSPQRWFTFNVPAKDRERAFTQAGSAWIVSGATASRRIAGVFDEATGFFGALIGRRDGTHAYTNP